MDEALKLRFAQGLLRSLPIPGRHLDQVIGLLNLDLDKLDTPATCRDRWNQFSVVVDEPRDLVQKHILLQGYFEWYETALLKKLLRPGDTYVDAGANIGWHVLVASRAVGPTGRVVAFEPFEETFARLSRNIEVNGLTNVTPVCVALSDRDGTSSLYSAGSDNIGGNTMFAEPGGTLLATIPMRRGEDVLAELGVGRVSLFKIDVEGAELFVLNGIARYLREGLIDSLLVEINPAALEHAGTSSREVIGLIQDAGFEVYDVRRPKLALPQRPDVRDIINVVCLRRGLG